MTQHFDFIIGKVLEAEGLTLTELAAQLGTKKQELSRLRRRRLSPVMRKYYKLLARLPVAEQMGIINSGIQEATGGATKRKKKRS
jgi:transcriptional regulator with XRE-family HTH domain